MIIGRLDGDELSLQTYKEKIFKFIEKGISGFIIFGGSRNEIKDFIREIQSLSEIPLFIASDIECGVGQQIRDTTLFPCHMAMAAAINKNISEDVELLRSSIGAIARESIDIGINMPLIPVLDVNQNPDNPIICTRAFSDNPEDVAWFGPFHIKELEKSGILSCAKHFPGHGDTSIDSHISLPVITKSLEDLFKIDLMPFIESIKVGISCIMVGHLSVPPIDSKPATLSIKVITDLLRKRLGFDGLILTDALNMKALKGFENVSTECIKAGADILLLPVDIEQTAKAILSAVESKEIVKEQINRAINRILKKKIKIQHMTTSQYLPLVTEELIGDELDYHSHKALSAHITDKSITLLKNTEGLLPIRDNDKIHVMFAGENKYFESSLLKNHFKNILTGMSDINKLKNKVILCAIFTSIAAWKGSSGIDEDEKNRINELIRTCKNSIVISFGCPYVLRHFKEADILIAGYEATEHAQKSVIKCLKGEVGFKGRLPVKINFS